MKTRRLLDHPLYLARRAKRPYRVRDRYYIGVAVRGDGRKHARSHSAPVNKVHRLIEQPHGVVSRGQTRKSYASLRFGRFTPCAFLSRMAWRW